MFRIEADRLVIVRNGTVEVALGFPGDATVDVRIGIFRIELERLVIVGAWISHPT